MDFVVTKEMLEQAATYMPLAVKTSIAKQQAEAIVRRSDETTAIRANGESLVPLPPRYYADERVRSVLEMAIFTSMYLNVTPINEDGTVEMDEATYDVYAGSHIFGQLTAMKGGTFGRDNPELKTRIINMLSDFNDYQKRLTAEIRVLMTLYNDPVDRFLAMNAAMTTPEGMEGLLNELKDAAESIEEYKRERTEGEAYDSGDQSDTSV